MNIVTATQARFNFDYAIGDVTLLLRHHDEATGKKRGRPSRELEVLKRSAVILAITAWESYVEDTLREEFQKRLQAAVSPRGVESAFNRAADEWLRSTPTKPAEVMSWSGDGWKAIIKERFEQDVASLNTPGSRQVRKLSKRYLAKDITAAWTWRRTSAERAAERLDKLIQLRGSLTHRGRELFETQQAVRKKDALEGRRLVSRLVECTDRELGVQPRKS